MDAAAVATALAALPMHAFDDLAVRSCRLPPEVHGFYAWWQTPGALPGVTATPHARADLELLYVGIAPANATSASHLRGRLAKHHRGAIGSSTLRFTLTALLWQGEGWEPTKASRPQLDDRDLAGLQRWQREHLSVQWVAIPDPWVLERAVIQDMRPPLNRDHNAQHTEHKRVGLARAGLHLEAARRPRPHAKRR